MALIKPVLPMDAELQAKGEYQQHESQTRNHFFRFLTYLHNHVSSATITIDGNGVKRGARSLNRSVSMLDQSSLPHLQFNFSVVVT